MNINNISPIYFKLFTNLDILKYYILRITTIALLKVYKVMLFMTELTSEVNKGTRETGPVGE